MQFGEDKTTIEFYDEQSENYDDVLAKGQLAARIREHLQNKLEKSFKEGDRLLEIGCGTGTDAIYLARRGMFITAIDASEKMLEIAKQKAVISDSGTHIELINMLAEDISDLNGKIFAGAYSNFNALNHVHDLKKFSTGLASVLASRSRVFIVMLNKICLIEALLHLLFLKPVLAFKKLINRSGTLAVKVNLYFPRQAGRFFSDNFKLNSITGFGILIPPDNFFGLYRRFKLFLDLLYKAEKLVSGFYPFYNFCDHYLIELERK